MALKQRPHRAPTRKRRVPTRVLVGLAIVFVVVAILVPGYTSWSSVTGFGGGTAVKETTRYSDPGLQEVEGFERTEEEQNPRTLWDWISLLGVGSAVALVGYVFTRKQKERDEAVANHRAQGEALQSYLDRMSNLMIEQKFGWKPEDSVLRRVAQARTIETLLVLDKDHKRLPLKLLYELGLIDRCNHPITLTNASLDRADLSELALSNAYLRGVDLRATDLSGANLSGSDLSGADLTNADLSGTDLSGANLFPYDERYPAKLSMHNLKDNATGSSRGELRYTTVNPKQIPTRLRNTNLEKATLNGTILGNTDLGGARGLEPEQLEQAIGNRATKLPKGLEPPDAWKSEAIEKQIQTRNEQQERDKAHL